MLPQYKMVLINVILSTVLLLSLGIYRYIFKRKINLLYLLILISILPIISIFRTGTYESGDLATHTAYSINFYENLRNGIFIPIWSSSSCGGYGCPIFEFLYSLPYYISAVIHFIGFSFLDSTKLTFAASYILSGITMYMWGKDQFGKISGFVMGIFYLFAPYHFVDLHFRASIGEVLSFAFIPLIFLFMNKIIAKTPKIKWIIFEGISIALLALSHFATFIITIQLVTAYALLLCFFQKPFRISNFIYSATSMIIGLLLSCYKWLPAISEVKYTWFRFGSDSLTFVPFPSLLFSPTYFGFLFQGHHGELNLILGYPHIALTVILIIFLIKRKLSRQNLIFGLWLILSLFFIIFMIIPQSKIIWQFFSYMGSLQFSWRLLAIVAFITSTIAGLVVTKIRKNVIIIIICAVTILSTILNWGNRKMVPEDYSRYLNDTALYSEYLEPSNSQYLKDYLERVGQISQLVANHPQKPLEIISGKADIMQIVKTPTDHEYLINATVDSWLKENTLYFPGWTLRTNNKIQKIYYQETKYKGYLIFPLNKGLYDVKFTFTDTPVRHISKIISFISFLFISIYFIIALLKKRQK